MKFPRILAITAAVLGISMSIHAENQCILVSDRTPPDDNALAVHREKGLTLRLDSPFGKGYWESKDGSPYKHHGRYSKWWVDSFSGIMFKTQKDCEDFAKHPGIVTGN